MSIVSSRTLQIGFSGDINTQIIQSALENDESPGELEILTLVAGDNELFPPAVDNVIVTGLTIIPPAGNVVAIILKGLNTDLGIPLHLTDPSSIALNTTFTSFFLNVASDISGLRLIWT